MSVERPHAPEGPLGRPDPWFATVLRVVVYAVTAGVITFPLSVPEGIAAAMIGAGAGSLVARFVARSQLRLPTVALLGGVGLLGVFIATFMVVDSPFVAPAFGPAAALILGDAVMFGLGGLVVATVLRTLSARKPAFTILEAGLIAGGFATLLVAHRNGAIHRPYELADPLITAGEDPTVAILAIGAAGALVVGLLLLAERSFSSLGLANRINELTAEGVSRKHAKLHMAAGNWMLEDLGSHNGTIVDGNEVPSGEKVALNDRHQVLFGNYRCVFMTPERLFDLATMLGGR